MAKFYYEKVELLPQELYAIQRPKKAYQDPKVLSKVEIQEMLKQTQNIKHKCLIILAYGWPLGETLRLTLKNIDSHRNVLYIIAGKGKKNRQMPLPQQLLLLLREHYKIEKPITWIGVNIPYIQAMLGHSNIKTTKHYTHIAIHKNPISPLENLIL